MICPPVWVCYRVIVCFYLSRHNLIVADESYFQLRNSTILRVNLNLLWELFKIMMQPLIFSVVDGIDSKPVAPDLIWILLSGTRAVFGCPVLAELDGLWLCQQVTWCFRRTFQDFSPFTGPNLMLYTISTDLNFKLSIFPIVANFPAEEFWMNPGTFWKLHLSSQNCLIFLKAFPSFL